MKPTPAESEQAILDRARRAVSGQRLVRWNVLFLALVFFAMAGSFVWKTFNRLESIPLEQVTEGFTVGFAFAVLTLSFGFLGAMCLAKFLQGFSPETKMPSLLLKYHDELQKLKQ